MLKYLSPDDQVQFKELQKKLSTFEINENEQQLLTTLVNKAQKAFQERDALIDQLKSDIEKNNLDVRDLFSAAQIAAAGAGKAGGQPAVKKKQKAAATKLSGPILLSVKVGKGAGAPSKYSKGQKFPPFVPKNLKALSQSGDLAVNLEKYYTDAGRVYFASPEGQVELKALLNYIRSGKVSGG